MWTYVAPSGENGHALVDKIPWYPVSFTIKGLVEAFFASKWNFTWQRNTKESSKEMTELVVILIKMVTNRTTVFECVPQNAKNLRFYCEQTVTLLTFFKNWIKLYKTIGFLPTVFEMTTEKFDILLVIWCDSLRCSSSKCLKCAQMKDPLILHHRSSSSHECNGFLSIC